LIFLISFALVHWIAILVRRRSAQHPPPFRTSLFPAVPVLGGLACVALAVFQGFAVPSAGAIVIAWLAVGGLLFLFLLARHARIADASLAASDPELVRLRGHSPLVLVPIANPDNARALVAVANALAPPEVGRVLLLSVVVAPRDWRPSEDPRPLLNTQAVLGEAIAASVEAGLFPESLTTVALQPWKEIGRVAKVHGCESLLLGLSQLTEESAGTPLDDLLSGVDCDVVVLRAPKDWRVSHARRILIPTAGRGGHDRLLARLLSSLSRSEPREILFLRVVGKDASPRQIRTAERSLHRTADDLGAGHARVLVASSNTPTEEVAAHASQADLLILGVQRIGRRQKVFGQFVQQIARTTSCPLLLICRGR
jgi:nucleotide-binding universal stress UspA family protein